MTSGHRVWVGHVTLALLLVAGACSPPPNPALPVPDSVPNPNPADIESVLFLIGDTGDAYLSTSPTLARLQLDVETWANQLDADSSVAVFVLGDIRYPEGVRDPDSPEFEADTAVVMGQLRVVSGPAAMSRGARIYFMAGNHDWGLREHWDGYVRLTNLDDVIRAGRERIGVSASLVPEVGTGGPFVIDWGEHLRLLILDTAWWMLAGDVPDKRMVLDSLSVVYPGAGDREVMIMAHHPFRSAGPHGGQFSFWRTIGVRYLLFRSGAILQDLTSEPFRELEQRLRSLFATEGPPIAFIGGHDHSLQIIQAEEPTDPLFNLISGSGSKMSEVGRTPGLLFGHSAPGYMRLLVEKDGGMSVYVEGVDQEFLECPTREPDRTECMTDGIAAFRTLHWLRLR